MDKSTQYSLANLYQKARDLYANSPIAKPIAQFQANNRAAVQKVQVPDTLQSFVQGANEGAVGFTGLDKKIPLGAKYTPQTTAGKVSHFAGGAVGYALGAGKLLGPVEKAIQGAVVVPQLAKSAPVLSRAANFVARKAAPALIAEAATAVPTSIIQSRVDQKPILPIYAQNVAGNIAGRAVGEGIGVAAPLVGKAGKFAVKETKDAVKKTDAEMFNRFINLAIDEGDNAVSRLGAQMRNKVGEFGKKQPLIRAAGSGDVLHPDIPLLKLVFEPGTQPKGVGSIIPATKLKEMPELAQYVQGPANKAAERLYKQAYSGGFVNPKAFLGQTETPELQKSNVLPTIKPTSPQLGEPGYTREPLGSGTSPSLDQSRSNPLLDTTISPTKIDNKVLSQSAEQSILSEPNTSLTIPKQNEVASQSLRISQQGQSLSGEGSQLQQQGTKNPVSSFVDSAKIKANELYTKSLDRFNPISQIGKQAGQNQKIENAMTGYYGAASTANYHVDFELAPILKSADPKDLRMAAIAQRDLELAGRDIKGSTAQADAAKNIEALQQKLGPEGYAKLKESLGNLYSYQDKLVQDYLVKTGVISPEAYASMKANNQSYVPFKRVMDTVDEQLGFSPGKQAGSVSSQNVIKGIKGSTKEVVDPLQSIVDNTYKIVGLAKRQQVAQSIVNLKSSLPEGVISKLEGNVGNKATISLFENGKQVKYQVPQEVADAAKGMTEDQMGTIVKLLAAPTKIFRATATGLNPEFMLPNVTRDLQNAFVNVGLNPLNFVKGMSSLMKKDELYQDFLKSGGQTSTVKLDQPFLQTRVGEITGEKGLVTDKLPRIFEWIQKAGEYSEQPTRIAAFDSAKQKFLAQGLSAEEASIRAANAAQESTVNFARRGSETRTLNAVYAFLNARAQGVDRLVRSLKNDPKGAGTRMAFLTVAPALALYAHNRNFNSYTDDRVISPKDKESNFIFMLSDTPIKKLGGAQYIKIPKAEIGKFANPVEQFLSYADGKGGDVSSALLSALKSFSPIDNAGDLVPTAVRPLAEDRANTNFFTGYDIVPSYKKNLPPSAQFGSTTAPLFKAIGDKTNLSPARLQNLAEGYGTGYTKIAEQVTQPILPGYTTARNERGADINRTPGLRRFFGGEKKSQEEVQTDAVNKIKAIKADISQIRNGIKKGTVNEKQGNDKIQQLQKDLGTQQQYIKGPEQSSAFAGKVAASDMPIQAPLPAFKPNLSTPETPALDNQQIKDIKSNLRLGLDVSPEELKAAYIGNISDATTPYAKAVQQKELLSKMSSIEKSQSLSEDQKKTLTDEILKRSGLSQGDIEYYKVSKQSSDLKSLYANEQLSKLLSTPGTTPNTVNNWLINGRKTVNGEQLLNDSVISSLVNSGVIGKADGEYLKKVTVENGQVKVKQSSKKPKKIKMPKLKKIKVKKQKQIKLKPISLKLKKPKKIKVR